MRSNAITALACSAVAAFVGRAAAQDANALTPAQVQAQADSLVRVNIVGRLDLEKYKATVKG